MKLNLKLRYLFPLLSLVILQGKAENQGQDQGQGQGQGQGQVQITDEQLDNFSYGNKEYRLAVVGDTGIEKETKEVMNLRKYDALLHLGDYDYRCLPDDYFNKMLDADRDYQFLGVIGNHDTSEGHCSKEESQSYIDNIYNEMTNEKNGDFNCEFSPSKFMWVCVHDNIRIIGLSPDIRGADDRKEQLDFLKKHLEEAKEDWKICSWHYYDRYFHTGRYQSNVNLVSGEGESFYDFCKDHGAIILSAHDHVYARSRVMTKFKEPIIDEYDGVEDGRIAQIRPGATLNILNGVGGFDIYIEQGEQMNYPHWQKKYAKGENEENRKKFGGLFCTFNVDGNNRKAYCELLRLNSSEEVFDSFYIYRNEDPATVPYNDIDKAFKEKKIMAYRMANNLPEDHHATIVKEDPDKTSRSSPILLIGSIIALTAGIGGGILFFIIQKNKNKSKNKNRTINSNNESNSNINKDKKKFNDKSGNPTLEDDTSLVTITIPKNVITDYNSNDKKMIKENLSSPSSLSSFDPMDTLSNHIKK
jgi:hypothetical protein